MNEKLKDLLSLYDGGYNLLPSGRAKVLTLLQEHIEQLGVMSIPAIVKTQNGAEWDNANYQVRYRIVAQAQLDDVKKHFGGK